MPETDQVESILREWCDRRDRGDAVDPQEILAEHPDLAAELGPRIDALEALDAGLDAAFEDPQSLPAGPPEEIAGYRIVREIGRGGMGVVYEAEQAEMGRRVALKLLAPVFTDSPQAVKRFRREAKAAGLLHHTNIVPVHTMGQHGEYWYYTMEYVEGGSLAEWIDALGPLRRRASNGGAHFLLVAGMFAGVADALASAHRAGIIHRDVKPANLLLAPDDTLKIVDFGMARMDEAPSLTLSGEVLGTPVYMSPEQARARKVGVDHRTDIYSLGATLYEVLTRRPPFQGKSALDICSQIITRDPPALRKVNPRVPRDLAVIVTKSMEKERKDRYASAALLARDLRRFVDGVPIHARPVGLVGRGWRKAKRHKVRSSLVAAVVVLAAVATFFVFRASDADSRWRLAEYERLLACGQDQIGVGRADRAAFEPAEHPENAHDFFTRAIEILPDRPEAWWMRALDPDRPSKEEALRDIAEARKRGLPAPIADALHAATRAKPRGARVDRQKFRRRANALTGDSPLAAYAKAQLLWRFGGKDDAIVHLGRAIASASPSSLTAYLARRLRAAIRFDCGDLSAALEDYLAIRGRGDDRPSVEIVLGSIYRRLGNQAAADHAFDRALAGVRSVGHKHRWCPPIGLGIRLGEEAFLDRTSREALAAYPDDGHILFQRARALSVCGRPQEALEVCDRVLGLEKGKTSAIILRARCLASLGRYEELIALLDGPSAKSISLNPTAASLRATALTCLGRFDEALASLDRAEALGQSAVRAAGQRATILFAARRLPAALKATKLALRAGDQSAERYNQHAAVLERMQKLQHAKKAAACALDAANRALLRDPGDAEAMLQRGLALVQQGQAQEAVRTCRRALGSKRISAADRYAGYEVLSYCFRDLGRLDEAIVALRSALEIRPNDMNAARRLTAHLHKCGRLPEALKVADRAVRGRNPPASLHNLHGAILKELGKPRLAKGAFLRALAAADREILRDEDDAEALFERAFSLAESGDNQKAVDAYRRALVSKRLSAEDRYSSHRNLGFCYVALGQPGEAIAALRSALKIRPGDLDAARRLTGLLFKAGRLVEALEAFQRALREHPESAELHNNRGMVLLALRRRKEALAAFEKACELDATIALSWTNLGHCLMLIGRPEDAIPVFRKALDLEENDVRTLTFYATCLMALDYLDAAERNMRKATRLAPQYYLTYLNLAQLSEKKTCYEQAVKYFDQALSLAPGPCCRIHYWRARLLAMRLGRFAAAEADLDAIASATPPDAWSCYRRLCLLKTMGRYEDVLTGVEAFRADGLRAAYAATARRGGQDIAALLKVLEVGSQLALGRKQEAMRMASSFLAKHPGLKPNSALANLYAVAGDRERALKMLEKVAPARDPYFLRRAQVFAALGDKKEALDNLESAIENQKHLDSAKLPPRPAFLKWKDDPCYRALAKRMHATE